MFKSRSQLNQLSTLGLVLILAGAVLPASALGCDFEDQAQLDDWQIFGPAKWRIEDGVLICEGLGGLGGAIVPEKDKGRQTQRMELKDIACSDGTFEFKIQLYERQMSRGWDLLQMAGCRQLPQYSSSRNTRISNFCSDSSAIGV